MATTETTNKGLNIIGINDPNWGPPTNENMTLLDQILTNALAIAASVGTHTLSQTQIQNICLRFTGVIATDAIYNLPAGVSSAFIIINATTGAGKLTFGSAGGGGVVSIPQGNAASIYISNSAGVGGAVYINTPLSSASANGQVLYNKDDNIVGSDELTYSEADGLFVYSKTDSINVPVISATFGIDTTGIPEIGIGTEIDLETNTAPGVYKVGAKLMAVSTAISAGVESFDFSIMLRNLGAFFTAFKVTSAGVVSAAKIAGNWIATQAEAETINTTINDKIMTPLRVQQMIYAHEFISAAQTIASGALRTMAHGFGDFPSTVQLSLSCVTAEFGYVAGDALYVEANQTSDIERVNSVYTDATNIYVRYSSAANCFVAGNKATGAAVKLTNANWRLYVIATY